MVGHALYIKQAGYINESGLRYIMLHSIRYLLLRTTPLDYCIPRGVVTLTGWMGKPFRVPLDSIVSLVKLAISPLAPSS